MKYVQNTYYGHSWIQCKRVCCGSISGLHKANYAGITVTTTLAAYIYFKLNTTAPCLIKLYTVTDMYNEIFQTEQESIVFVPQFVCTNKRNNILNLQFVDKQIVA